MIENNHQVEYVIQNNDNQFNIEDSMIRTKKNSFDENKYNKQYIILQFRISFNSELYDKGIISFQTFTDMNNYLHELSNKELRKQALVNEEN